LATRAELEAITSALYRSVADPNVLMSIPRIVEAWTTRPPGG
jgi:hypothetical protein